MVSSNGTGGGNWGATSTWSGGIVPVDGDSVTVVASDTVTFVNSDDSASVDLSSWSGLAGLVVDGVFRFSTAANRIAYLKMASTADITGTGWFYVGNTSINDASPDYIPRSSKVTICFNGTYNGSICTTSHIRCYGWYNVNRAWSYLSSNYSAGSTQIAVDEDLDLQANDQIYICSGNVNGGVGDTYSGVYTVQSYDSGTRVITLTNGLATYNRNQGDIVGIYSHPIVTDNVQSSVNQAFSSSDVICEGVQAFGGITAGGALTNRFTGCTMGCGKGNYGSGGSGIYRHCIWTRTGQWTTVDGTYDVDKCAFLGTGRGGGSGTAGRFTNMEMQNCGNGAYMMAATGPIFCKCRARNNSSDIYNMYAGIKMQWFDCQLLSPTENSGYRNAGSNFLHQVEIIGYDGDDAGYRMWCKGGHGYTQSSVQYGEDDTLCLIGEDDLQYVWRDFPIWLKGSVAFSLTLHGRKSAISEYAGMMLIDPAKEPFNPNGDVIPTLASAVIPADSVDSWVDLTVSYTPVNDRHCYLRVWMKKSGANAYFHTKPLEQMLPSREKSGVRQPVMYYI